MKYERKKRENRSEIEKKHDEDAMLCNTLWLDRRTGSSKKKHFLPFRVLLDLGIDQNFPKKNVFFNFLALFREKFRFPAKTFLA